MATPVAAWATAEQALPAGRPLLLAGARGLDGWNRQPPAMEGPGLARGG